MFQTNSLRFRVAFYYALFGAGLSILLSGVVFRSLISLDIAVLSLSKRRHGHHASMIFRRAWTDSLR